MSASGNSNKSEFVVGGKYRLVRKIGSGSFGDIYLSINITNGEVRFSKSYMAYFVAIFLVFYRMFLSNKFKIWVWML